MVVEKRIYLSRLILLQIAEKCFPVLPQVGINHNYKQVPAEV